MAPILPPPDDDTFLLVPPTWMDADFWAHFAEHYWEKKSCVIRGANTFNVSQLEQLVFSSLASSSTKEGWSEHKFRFFLDGEKLPDQEKRLCAPHQNETTAAEYATRLGTKIGDKSFEMVSHDIETLSPDLFTFVRRFVAPLQRVVGIPQGGNTVTNFVRTSHSTTFGIHIDFAAIFALIMVGDKTILTWPNSYFSDQASARREKIEDHIETARVLSAEPGDIIYWPSTEWHVGTNSAELSASMHIAFNFREDIREKVLEQAINVAKATRRTAGNIVSYKGTPDAANVPPELLDAVTQTEAMFKTADVNTAIADWWLKTQSTNGFAHPPARTQPEPVATECVFLGCKDLPILTRKDGAKLICAANGYLIPTLDHPHITALIEAVNSGQEFSIETLSQQLRGTVPTPILCRLLAEFEAVGAVQRNA